MPLRSSYFGVARGPPSRAEAPVRPLKSGILLSSNTMPLQHRRNNVFFLGGVGCFAVVGTSENKCNSAGIHPGAKIHLMPIGASQEAAGFSTVECYPERQKGFCTCGLYRPPAPTSQLTTARMLARVLTSRFTPLRRRRQQPTLDSDS